MHNHWFTIRNYWQQVAPDVIGSKITQAFTFQKNECSFILLQGRDRLRVDYSGNSELPYSTVTDRLNIPKQRVQLFESLEGLEIRDITMTPADRVLRWKLNDGLNLFLEFFGAIPNVFVTDNDLRILETFKEYDRGEYLNFRDFSGIPYPLPDDFNSRFHNGFTENRQKSISNILTAILPHWISQFSKEALFRIGIEDSIQGVDLPETKREELIGVVRQIYSELEKPDALISKLPEPKFSLIDWQHAPDIPWKIHQSMEAAYPKFVGIFYQGKQFRDLRKRLHQSLGNRLEREQRKLDKQRQDIKSYASPGHYRNTGDLLMANLQNISAGAEQVTLKDIISGRGEVNIKLDPRLSPVENAQRYYGKAKKASRGGEQLGHQIDETETTLLKLHQLYDQLDEISGMDELRELVDQTEDLGISLKQKRQSSEPQTRLPYTEFRSPDGWRVLVGRAARDNDELTFHIANKDDFWFHAENVPGSHVIAVADNKNLEKPPPDTLKFAAGLAAGYSQAKHSGLVPVVYTKRKYVTKPRDAGPGLVRYQFEESIIVEPVHP